MAPTDAEEPPTTDDSGLTTVPIDQNASFGIEEGEVDELEKKWITWYAHSLFWP